MFRDRQAFHPGINNYVPAMQFAASLAMGSANIFSLGSPGASDDDIIDTSVAANAVALTEELPLTWTSDARYGRTLITTISGDPGAAGSVIDCYGWDYLGQPMIERFTVANGSTAIQYGKKAFYKYQKTKIVTASTNVVTIKIGTGTKCGLPFKGSVVWAKENNVMVPLYNRDFELWGDLADADATAGASLMRRAPCPGFVKTLFGIPGGAGSTTNAATTVEINTVAVTGLTVTMDQDTQTLVSDVPTTEGYNANNRLRPGDRIELVHAATTSAGTCSVGVEVTPTQFTPFDATVATNVTGDPRGLYESIVTMDAVKELIIALIPDNAVDASNLGGLHGIRHYYA